MKRSAALQADAPPLRKRRVKTRLSLVKKGGRQSLKDNAYNVIKHLIITCAFRPGEYINEAHVSAKINIGRTPVHQAIERLMLEGMVAVIPRKGVIVKPVTLDEIVQIIDVRMLNECHCAKLAAQRINKEELAQLDRILKETKVAMSDRDNERMMLLDRDFHSVLAGASKNFILADCLSRLHERSLRFWFISLNAPGYHLSVLKQHEAILDGIRRRDTKATEHAMRSHIEAFRQNIIQHL